MADVPPPQQIQLPPTYRGENMKMMGVALIFFGLVVWFGAWLMPISVSTDSTYDTLQGLVPSQTVINLGLISNRDQVFLGGMALFISGIILYGSGAMVWTLNRLSAVDAAKEDRG